MSTLDSTNSIPTSELDLSQPEDVLAYLADTPFASTRAEPLSGGTANFIFRLHLATPLATANGTSTLIFKHAKPWIAIDKEFACDIKRQNFEAIALRHVHAFLPADALATVPVLLHHDPLAHVLIMEDAGPNAHNLKDLLRESPLRESASRELGTALGKFLAVVHVRGSADAVLLAGVQKNEDSRRITAWITYGRLVDTLRGEDRAAELVEPPLIGADGLSDRQVTEIGMLADATAKKVYGAQTFFTMGDFWTGNIVVRLTANGEIERIFVIDWEGSKPGLPFLDFAQFTAEMNTLRRFHPGADASVSMALSAYVEAYRQGAQVDDEFVRGAASHVGAHMVTITPWVKTWGSKEKTREVIEEGVEYLLGGMHGDTAWLRASVVGGLLSETSA